jgi:hypothetical protein
MSKDNIKATRGDLVVTQGSASCVHVKDGAQSRTFWALGRVTSVSRDGRVKAYRTFGAHHDTRQTPRDCHLVTAQAADLTAIEHDMTGRIAKQWNANEFCDLDSVRAYLQAFKRVNVTGDRVQFPSQTDIRNADDAQIIEWLQAAQQHNPLTGHSVDIETVIMIREERRRRQLRQEEQTCGTPR